MLSVLFLEKADYMRYRKYILFLIGNQCLTLQGGPGIVSLLTISPRKESQISSFKRELFHLSFYMTEETKAAQSSNSCSYNKKSHI